MNNIETLRTTALETAAAAAAASAALERAEMVEKLTATMTQKEAEGLLGVLWGRLQKYNNWYNTDYGWDEQDFVPLWADGEFFLEGGAKTPEEEALIFLLNARDENPARCAVRKILLAQRDFPENQNMWFVIRFWGDLLEKASQKETEAFVEHLRSTRAGSQAPKLREELRGLKKPNLIFSGARARAEYVAKKQSLEKALLHAEAADAASDKKGDELRAAKHAAYNEALKKLATELGLSL